MDNKFSLWLIPQEGDKEYLDKIINDLGQKYDAPLFTPHLTLLGDISMDYESLKKIVDKMFINVKKMRLKKITVSQSEKFIKTIFIEIKLNNTLINLFKILSSETDNRSIETFKPHISLIYKTMSEEERLKIIQKLNIKDEFTIDRVYVVDNKKPTENYQDVKNWEILYKKYLNNH